MQRCWCRSISEGSGAPIIFLAALTSLLSTAKAEPGGQAVSQDASNGGRVEGGEVCGQC